MIVTDAEIASHLTTLTDETGAPLLPRARIDGIVVNGGLVQVSLRAARDEAVVMEKIARQVESSLRGVPGIKNATVVLTAPRAAPAATSHVPPAATSPVPPAATSPVPPAATPHAPPMGEKLLPQARFVVAVASGKGGVGKSTLSINLAVALAKLGLSVGLVDADIHGPSMARMIGVAQKPEVRGDRIMPIEAHGIACMSMGFMVPESQAMIWRGPMVMGALQQILAQTEWGKRDIMIVDLPPGTGDAQLTLTQRVDLDGAIIISTPQDIALIDARRGVAMFEKVGVPILGLVENMSFFVCPHCHGRADIFGHGGARDEAAKLGVPFLGEVPLQLAVREAGDAGTPVVLAAPDDPAAIALREIAAKIWEILQKKEKSHA